MGQRIAYHTFNIAPNLLKQDFSASAPNQKWAGDITYVWTKKKDGSILLSGSLTRIPVA